MALAPGTRLGAYEVSALIGAGGMGEVYRARDTTLKRDVALKVLPQPFATDADRLARFEREALTLASLNHPNIAQIYGVERQGGALVMELVEGPTLADGIVHGALPLDETLRIAQQIAEALEAAHDKAIVHRDLKPANIKITPNGIVKVLDFGLAKAASGETSSPDLSHSPTTVAGADTRAGVILGTAAYMSPEQARGKVVDKRADIWAFGCVLFEMLSGRAPFARDTLTDTLAAVVQSDPDWQALPATTPARIRDLLRRCLQKDPQRRLRDIGDARLDIEDAVATPVATGNVASAVDRRRVIAWVIASAVLASVITASMLLLLRLQPAAPAADFTLTIAPPSASGIQPVDSLRARPEVSPDGSVVAYHDRMGTLQLRRLNAQSPEPLRPATGTDTFSTMIWSSDSKYLVFPDGQTLKRIRVPDGAPEVVGSLPGQFPVGSLSDNGMLLFVCCQPGRVALFLVPEPGAEPREISVPGLKEGTPFGPWFLPDGEDFLISTVPQGSEEVATYLVTLREGRPTDPVLLTRNASGIRYTPAGGGRVLFVRNDGLYAQALNRTARKLEGDPELIQQGVATRGTSAFFSVSRSGVVVWRPGRAVLAQVTMFDRSGQPIGTAGAPSESGALNLSPDEEHIMVAARDGRSWLLQPNQPGHFNLPRGHLSMKWNRSSTGFVLPQASRIVERPISGSGEGRELARVPGSVPVHIEDVSEERTVALFRDGASTLFSVRLDGVAADAVATKVETGEPVGKVSLSPDTRWIVYHPAGSQQEGVYVHSFPAPRSRKQIAATGQSPVWRGDGKEILYLDRDRVWTVRVDTSGGEFRASPPEMLFTVRSLEGGRRVNGIAQLAVSRDGSRIYYQQPVEQPDSDVIHVRTGWAAAVRP
jgi:hypothetical protein